MTDRTYDAPQCPENFRESLTGTFSEIFNGLRPNFLPIDSMNMRTKFEVRNFTCSWDTQKIGQSMDARSLFSKICNRAFTVFGWTLWMFRPNLKFVVLPVPEIIGGTQKIWTVPAWICLRPRSLLSKIFNVLLFGYILWMFQPNLKSVASPLPEIIAIGVLGGGCEPPILGKAVYGVHVRHTSSFLRISPCSPGSRWMAFGLRRAKVLG